MSYEKIDTTLYPWATKNRLHVYTQYKEYEVRSIEIVNAKGKKAQLWLDTCEDSTTVVVHIWDYKKRKREYSTDISLLSTVLDNAYNEASLWLESF